MRALLPLAVTLAIAGCASAPAEPPRIQRISAAELEAKLQPPAAALPLSEIVASAKQGITSDALIERIRASGSRYTLTATQVVELAREGVPLAVLDFLVAAERRAIFDDMAAEANRREEACRARSEEELRACRLQTMGPVLVPGPNHMMNCFPLGTGSIYWRCF